MSIVRKLLFALRRSALFSIRPFIGNRRYTRRYISLLRRYGVDIAPYNTCGFIAPSVSFDGYAYERIHIGSDVFLTHDVILLVHDQSLVTAWNNSNSEKDKGSFYGVRDIHIGSNVFIGMRSIVLPGASIGDDVVIGAGSVVKGTVPSGTVWAGNPARQIEEIEGYKLKLEQRRAFETRDFNGLD